MDKRLVTQTSIQQCLFKHTKLFYSTKYLIFKAVCIADIL